MNNTKELIETVNKLYDDIHSLKIKLYEACYEPYEDFYLGEMATVNTSLNRNMRIQVNPDPRRIGVPYFKVFNAASPKEGETKVARLDFLDNHMQYHKDEFIDWNLSTKDIKHIHEFLGRKNKDYKKYTNWDVAKWKWNLEYFRLGGADDDIDKYINGEFDNDDRFSWHPSYVPSSAVAPEVWSNNKEDLI